MARTVAAALAVALLALAASPAAADHTFSHRQLVYGRLVDPTGAPLAGYSVLPGELFAGVAGACVPRDNTATAAWNETSTWTTTNAYGEFLHCFHAHALSISARHAYRVSVTSPGGQVVLEAEVVLDPLVRADYVTLVVPEPDPASPAGVPPPGFTVLGRLFQRGTGRAVEGVPVYGAALAGVPVALAVFDASGASVAANATTNDYGDFAVRMALPDGFAPARVEATARGQAFPAPAEAGYAAVKGVFGEEPDRGLQSFLRVEAGLFLAACLATAAGLLWRARRRA